MSFEKIEVELPEGLKCGEEPSTEIIGRHHMACVSSNVPTWLDKIPGVGKNGCTLRPEVPGFCPQRSGGGCNGGLRLTSPTGNFDVARALTLAGNTNRSSVPLAIWYDRFTFFPR